ncbi:hypothetical protein BJX65DRAFT_164055 [Aspergillus insuetus]
MLVRSNAEVNDCPIASGDCAIERDRSVLFITESYRGESETRGLGKREATSDLGKVDRLYMISGDHIIALQDLIPRNDLRRNYGPHCGAVFRTWRRIRYLPRPSIFLLLPPEPERVSLRRGEIDNGNSSCFSRVQVNLPKRWGPNRFNQSIPPRENGAISTVPVGVSTER